MPYTLTRGLIQLTSIVSLAHKQLFGQRDHKWNWGRWAFSRRMIKIIIDNPPLRRNTAFFQRANNCRIRWNILAFLMKRSVSPDNKSSLGVFIKHDLVHQGMVVVKSSGDHRIRQICIIGQHAHRAPMCPNTVPQYAPMCPAHILKCGRMWLDRNWSDPATASCWLLCKLCSA